MRTLMHLVVHLCKVRGYKTVAKFFPHEVSDMEPVTELLHFQDGDDWHISYLLILWLSIIVLVPFDLTTIEVPGMEIGVATAKALLDPDAGRANKVIDLGYKLVARGTT